MKKIFGLVFMFLLLVSSVLAAVSITPAVAHDSDDLICDNNGRATGYDFLWYKNSEVAPIYNGNPLSSLTTNVGDVITCKVYVPSMFGPQYVGQAQTTILMDNKPVNHAPIVNITYPTDNIRIRLGDTIQFRADASDEDGNTLTYLWNFGDGSTSTEISPRHTYAREGLVTATLTVNDGKENGRDSVSFAIVKSETPTLLLGITKLNSYNDRFLTKSDNFYRTSPLYVHFFVENAVTHKGVSGLDIGVKLIDGNDNSHFIDLEPYTGWVGTGIKRIYVLNGEPLFTRNGNYFFRLMGNVPVEDSWLGQANVAAYLKENNTLTKTKEVSILNNAVKFVQLPDVSLVQERAKIVFDLDDYVSDVETPDDKIKWAVSGNNYVDVNIDPATRNVVMLATANVGVNDLITFTADDEDGSIVSKTIKVVVNQHETPEGPVGGDNTDVSRADYNADGRTKRFAYMHGIPHAFSFSRIEAVPYKNYYAPGENARVIIGLRNDAGVEEDLKIKVYIPGSNEIQELASVHIEAGETMILDNYLKIPGSLKPGVYAARFIALNIWDSAQKEAYWQFVVTQ